MKIKYEIVPKLNTLTSKEMDLLFYLAKRQNEKTGFVEGVYYRDVIKQTAMCKQSFYNALKGLEEKEIISVEKLTDMDYNVYILENTFPNDAEYKKGYVNLNRKVFQRDGFKKLTAHEKYMLLEFMKITHENSSSMCIGVEKLYKKYMGLLKVSKRVIRGYLHRLKEFFSIGIKNGKYYITYKHSIFEKCNGKAEEVWYLEHQVKKECWRQHTECKEEVLKDVVEVIKQYRPQTSGTKEIVPLIMYCIRQSVDGIERKKRKLNAAYINKLARKALLSNPEPV